MRFINCEVVSEGIEHKEGLNEENKGFEKTIKLCTDRLLHELSATHIPTGSPTPYSSSFCLNIPLSIANTISLWAIFCWVKRSAYTRQQHLTIILLPNNEHALHENGASNKAPLVQYPLHHWPSHIFNLILKKGAASLAVEGLVWVDLEATLETRVAKHDVRVRGQHMHHGHHCGCHRQW